MALFQPSFIYPDARSGIGRGVVDATQDLTVSWRINGASAMTAFSITIYLNNSASTQKYTTGKITSGCPAYGTTSAGAIQLFSYTISAATLSSAGITNGNSYKLIIKQWWSANDSITQSSASAFITRANPSLSISAIGVGGVIGTRYYTFTGVYSQAQGDTLNWFRWKICYDGQTDNPFFDSENISGTMDISCTYDGFFANTSYMIRLTVQTENGVESDTGWVSFSCSYSIPETTGAMTASCMPGTDSVFVEWKGIGYFPGTATGYYFIAPNHVATIGDNTSIYWSQAIPTDMSFAAPWSIIWKGRLDRKNANIFTAKQSSGDIKLSYNYSTQTLKLQKGSTTLATQTGIKNNPTVTVVLTDTMLYIRSQFMGGGVYPASDLYPSSTLYPSSDSSTTVQTYSLSVSYTQETITRLDVGGYQLCYYLEILDDIASPQIIAKAITNGTYKPGLIASDYILVDWTDGINAGTINIGGDTLTGFALYRRHQDDETLVRIAETDINTNEIYDFGAASQQGPYTYYLFPKGANSYIASPITSNALSPCWWNWTLIEAEQIGNNEFTAIAEYRFQYNVSGGAMSNNNSPNILQNFTQYPKVQLAPQNYKSGTLTGLIGTVSLSAGQMQYADSLELRDAIMALSVTQNPIFLKNRKGDILRIKISAAVSMETADATIEQIQTATIPWVEVGSAEGASIYSTQAMPQLLAI